MELTQNEALKKGFEAQQAGQIQEAENFYRLVLNAQPNHPDANHNMGVLAVDVIKIQEALVYFKVALEANPSKGQYWLSYIDALIKLGNLKDAKTVFEQAKDKGAKGEAFDLLEQKIAQQEKSAITATATAGPYSSQPNVLNTIKLDKALRLAARKSKGGELAEAKNIYQNILQKFPKNKPALIGLQTLVGGLTVIRQDPPSNQLQPIINLYTQGKLQQALTASSQVLKKFPSSVVLYNIVGASNAGLMQFDAAIESFKQALKINPNDAEVHNNIGIALQGMGDLEAAIDSYKQAIKINSDYAVAYFNMGVSLEAKGDSENAIGSYKQALKIKPDYVEVYINMGHVLTNKGDRESAIDSYGMALKFKPDYAEAHNYLANTLKGLGRLEEAVASHTQAIVLKPDYAKAHINLGMTLQELGRLDEAEASYRQAIVLKTDDAAVYNNLGATLKGLGRLEEALARYDEAIELQVDYSQAYSNKNLCLNYSSNWSSQFIYQQHLEFEKQFGGLRVRVPLMEKVKKGLGERLRIGYVSGDFRSHSVAYFFEPLLQHHNANVVETFCYYNHKIVDDVTNRLMAVSEHWRSIVDNSHSNIVDRIIADKIDILVDLSGHTADNSLLVFAQKPAPILVTWLGSSNTTGLSAIDYRFTDVIADPIGETDQFHSEVLFRLPNGFHCYRGNETALVNLELPHKNRGHITFGSFNNISKLTPEVIKVWSKILNAVPQSHLLLKNSLVTHNLSHYAQLFRQEGISEDRIEYYGRLPSDHEHLELYGAVDIGLDPFPYNGVTTTCEALWMGVPVITLAGDRHAGRVGASILTNVGLTDFIAQDIDGYIQLAVEMAANPTYLQEIRRGLRKRMLDSPLCDGSSFANDIEKAYQEMWQTSLN